jgi:hypothetical protein
MTNIDVKTVGELFKSVRPTEEHRQKFGQTLPGRRARREKRLKRSAIGGDLLLKPGAFRLHPYGEADRDVFKRPDFKRPVFKRPGGADVTVVNSLRSTEASHLCQEACRRTPSVGAPQEAVEARFKAGASRPRKAQQHRSSAAPKRKSILQGGTQWPPNPSM